MRVRAMAFGLVGALMVTTAGVAAMAQDKGVAALSKASAEAANPSLTGYARGIRDEANRRDFAVRKLDVEAVVHGAIAQVTLDMEFAGQGEGRSEAWLHLDMPPGAVVTGYALDIEGKLVDGVLVDQQKAREAYERQVRGNIDPGIAEVDRTGGLNVRVFPVDAEKGRRIRVRFVAPVDERLALPLKTVAGSGTWSVRVSGADGPVEASLRGRSMDRNGTALVAAGSGRLDTMLEIQPQAAAVVASRHPTTGETFWQASGPLPAASAPTGGRLRIYWDRSRSMRETDLSAVLPRLRDAIEALKPETVELVTFSAAGLKRIEVVPGDGLTAAIRKISYAGASSFTPLRNEDKADTCLLVSDGRQTIDPVAAWSPPCRLFAIPAGTQADLSTLTELADRNGGRVMDGPTRPADWRTAGVERVLDASGRPLSFASLPAPSGQWRIALLNPNASPVRVVVGGREVALAPPPVSASFAGEGALLAARQLGRIETAEGRAAFIAMSRRYSVASPTLSFIVLEDADDYVRYDIEPPADYGDIEEYRNLRAEADKGKATTQSARFDKVLALWKDEVAWWEKAFDPNARPPAPKAERRAPGTALPMAAPPPPPPPPPPEPERDGGEAVEVAADAASGDDAIVVTGSRIVRPDLESPSPVTTVDSEQFDINGTITIETLLNESPQLAAYERNPGNFERVFRAYERKVGDLPVFYFDTAEWLYQHERTDEAVETLLSALELPDSDSRTVGIVAARLQRWGKMDLAVELRERQVALEPNRPQATRLLALALAERARRGGLNAKADYQRAIELLVGLALSSVTGDWDGIEVIALREANAMLPRLRALGGDVAIDPRLVKNLTADVRVVLDWTVDNVDLDLWVDEPNGERAIYSHNRTTIGGRLSNDMTNGFGPEEYWLRNAPAGTFTVRTNNYRADAIDPNGRPRLQVRLIRDFGRPNEREESLDVDAKQSKQAGNDPAKANVIGTVTVGKK